MFCEDVGTFLVFDGEKKDYSSKVIH